MKKLTLLLVSIILLGIMSIQAQQVSQVSGTVTSAADGMPIPGVSVLFKGTAIGITTDIDGNYSLKVPQGVKTLVFSFVGMKTIEVPVKKSTINVKMKAASESIDEVIITAYGTSTKESYTGSASTVKSESLREASTISVAEALQGKAAGVIVTNSNGQPGAGVSVRIRGVGSINGNRSPLYVVDGVPIVTGDVTLSQTSASMLNSINPEDIESQTILKDAAATALYGSRGANGVILITTKSGKEGKSKINFSAEYGIVDFANDKSLDYMNAGEYARYSLEGLKNYFLNNWKALPGQTNADKYETLLPKAEEKAYMNLQNLGLYHPQDNFDGKFDYNNMTLEQAKMYVTNPRNVNWEDEIFRKGTAQKYDFSYSGGNKKNKYYGSFGYLNNEGVAIGSSFERITGVVSTDTKLTKFLRIRLKESISHSTQEGQTTGKWYYANPLFAYYMINPTAPIYNNDGSVNNQPGFSNKLPNPILNRELNTKENETTRSLTNIFAEVKFTDWLNLTSTNGVDFIFSDDREVTHPKSNDGLKDKGSLDRFKRNIWNIVSSNLLNFNKSFNIHNIKALAGFEYKHYNQNYIGARVKTFASADLMYLSNGSIRDKVWESLTDDILISYLAKADYNYNAKYYASASWRRDGSSRLAKGAMWGDFYAGSLAWVLSKESFLEDTQWLDFLKLKLSYGTSGNLPSGFYESQALYAVSGKYLGLPAISLSQMENRNLSWEKSYTLNFGVDFTIFDRIDGTIELYQKDTKGLLNNTPLLWATGFSSYKENKGHLVNKGIDLEISSTNIKTNDFTWTTDFNLSHFVSKIKELDEPIDDFPYYYGEGDEMFTFKLREWAGVNPETGQPQWIKNKELDNGTMDRDITSNPLEAEKVKVGKGTPDIFGGITNTFSYKGFDFSFLFVYRLGGKIYNPVSHMMTDGSNIGDYNVYKGVLDKHWKKPGDNAEYARLIYGAPEHGNYNSNRRLIDGDFLKLKNITFGYTLPQSLTSKLKLSKVKFYVNATELFTLFEVPYINPEVAISGSALNPTVNFPPLSSYRFGVNIQF